MKDRHEVQQKERERLWHFPPILISFLIMVGIVLLPAVGFTGGKGKGHRNTPEQQLAKMTQHLKLTPDQQKRILPLLQHKHQKMQALHQEMQKVRQGTMAQIEKELTPEQRKKFRQHKQKRWNKGKGHKGKRGKGRVRSRGVDGDDDDDYDDDEDDDEEDDDKD